MHAELLVHREPWSSAASEPDLARELLKKDLDAGFLMRLEGGEAEARQRWGSRLAAGKLGIVHAPGKKPRLIGNGTVSGSNNLWKIAEKVGLHPAFHEPRPQ